jgi:hypothetical protein
MLLKNSNYANSDEEQVFVVYHTTNRIHQLSNNLIYILLNLRLT